MEPTTPEKIQVKAAYHDPPKPTHSEDIALYKKLAWTELRLKELESAVTTAVSEKVAAYDFVNEDTCGTLSMSCSHFAGCTNICTTYGTA